MNLEDSLHYFLKRVEVIVSMEMGCKIPTKEAYKEIKEEVRKLKKLKKTKKQIHHEAIAAKSTTADSNRVQHHIGYT